MAASCHPHHLRAGLATTGSCPLAWPTLRLRHDVHTYCPLCVSDDLLHIHQKLASTSPIASSSQDCNVGGGKAGGGVEVPGAHRARQKHASPGAGDHADAAPVHAAGPGDVTLCLSSLLCPLLFVLVPGEELPLISFATALTWRGAFWKPPRHLGMQAPFLEPSMAERVAQMLNYFLLHLAGPGEARPETANANPVGNGCMPAGRKQSSLISWAPVH